MLGEEKLLQVDELVAEFVAFRVGLVFVARSETRVARVPILEFDFASRLNLQLFHRSAGCYQVEGDDPNTELIEIPDAA